VRAIAPSILEALSEPTLVDCLLKRARHPNQVAFWLEGLGQSPVEVSCGRLLEETARAARSLGHLGLRQGDRVLLVLPTGLDFVFLLWGILRAGATPAPAYPPYGISQLETFSVRLLRMIEAANARFVVVPEPLREAITNAGSAGLLGADVLTPDEIWKATACGEDLPPLPAPDDLALIQFSSGSTGEPRGICLTHRNILSNIRGFLTRMGVQTDDVCVTWLPLYHDMGLIGTLMGALMSGISLVLFPPTDFLRAPGVWLQVMGKYRATISVAPQFAYNLCVRKVHPAELGGVDLSPVRVLLNGAEPVQADGVAAFEEAYRGLGLRPGVVTPCYGLAEATLATCMTTPGRALRLSRPMADPGDASSPEAAAVEDAAVVAVGPPIDNTEVRIRGANGEWQPDGTVGEICIRGPSLCRGILNADGIVPAAGANGWLYTGDLGFLHEGELHVTGRLKDLIIIGGRNLYPQDLEAVAAELPGFRPGRVAAFGVAEPHRATEVLVVVAETTEERPNAPTRTVAELRQRLLSRCGVVPYDIVLLGRGQIPLTTSGKVRRFQARSAYERNGFRDVVYRLRSGPPSTPPTPRRSARGAT
jgi:acyl-CoA synthetase (AMP-forming)/AMP-acid ligase II